MKSLLVIVLALLTSCQSSPTAPVDPYAVRATDTIVIRSTQVSRTTWSDKSVDIVERFYVFNQTTKVKPAGRAVVVVTKEYLRDGQVVRTETVSNSTGLGLEPDGGFTVQHHIPYGQQVRRTICPTYSAVNICDVLTQ